jgi:hypothetical protein
MANPENSTAIEMVATAEKARRIIKEKYRELKSDLKEIEKLGNKKFIPLKPSDDDRAILHSLSNTLLRNTMDINKAIKEVSEKAAQIWG